MTVPIMTAFWTSFAVLGASALISWIVVGMTIDSRIKGKPLRDRKRVASVLLALTVIVLAFGIWVPVFIPDLY